MHLNEVDPLLPTNISYEKETCTQANVKTMSRRGTKIETYKK